MKKELLILISAFLIFGLGLVAGRFLPGALSRENMQQRVTTQLETGIEKAIAEGTYNCCIEPACTMCYLEGNTWNDGEAGKCNCVDFIAQGKDPCPQCLKGMKEGTCGSKVETCPSL